MRTSQRVLGEAKGLPLKEFNRVINLIAPIDFRTEGDDDGWLARNSDSFSKIGVVWDLTVSNLHEMINDGVDLIVTHTYPFTRSKKSKLGYYDLITSTPAQEKEIKKLLNEFNVSLYRLHTRWDNVPGGNNDILAQLINLKDVSRVELGRVGFVKKTTLETLAKRVKRVLNSRVRFVGPGHKRIKKVMVVSGMGLSYSELIDYCAKEGVDVLISGDANKKVARHALTISVSLIDAGAAATEEPGMQELAKKLWSNGLKAEFYETKELFSYV